MSKDEGIHNGVRGCNGLLKGRSDIDNPPRLSF